MPDNLLQCRTEHLNFGLVALDLAEIVLRRSSMHLNLFLSQSGFLRDKHQ